MSPAYPASAVRIFFRGVEITGGNLYLYATVPPLNPIGPNGSKRRGRNASNRYFAALLVRQGGAK